MAAVPVVQLRGRVADALLAKRAGARALRSELALELTGDCDVYKPDGKLLCALRRAAIPAELCDRAYPTLQLARKHDSDNRAAYAGLPQLQRVKVDGTLSRQRYTVGEDGRNIRLPTAVAGYFDRQGGRFRYCRTTAFTADNVAAWNDLLPMVRHVAGLMRRDMPAPAARQQAYVDGCSQDYVIQGTPFTTLTININVLGTIHKDAGDYRHGIGVISVVRRGTYQGGLLCFPGFKVGADLHNGDVIFFDPHEWHAVTAFEGESSPDAERISVVYYARERMHQCGSHEQELERARALAEGRTLGGAAEEADEEAFA